MTTPLMPTRPRAAPLVARLMAPADLPAVVALQHQCYGPDFHEPMQAYAAKLAASPHTCWVLTCNTLVCAYLVCLPVEGDGLPPLHATAWSAPAGPDWLYLHDMAVSAPTRGAGAAQLLLACAIDFARSRQLPELGLIAVQDSVAWWARHGFVPTWPSARVSPDKLASFGPHAQFMLRPTD
jgi:GNAT superfamily N-acetyltransferase